MCAIETPKLPPIEAPKLLPTEEVTKNLSINNKTQFINYMSYNYIRYMDQFFREDYYKTALNGCRNVCTNCGYQLQHSHNSFLSEYMKFDMDSTNNGTLPHFTCICFLLKYGTICCVKGYETMCERFGKTLLDVQSYYFSKIQGFNNVLTEGIFFHGGEIEYQENQETFEKLLATEEIYKKYYNKNGEIPEMNFYFFYV